MFKYLKLFPSKTCLDEKYNDHAEHKYHPWQNRDQKQIRNSF